jgi:hypothetical protein
MIRPKPISRGNYRYQRKAKPASSLRYDVILEGAVRVYPDGRQVCQDNAAGRREYAKRIEIMVQRQNFRCGCSLTCKERLTMSNATFGHCDLRGAGGSTRDDRIEDENGEWMNAAETWDCNGKKGSKRI